MLRAVLMALETLDGRVRLHGVPFPDPKRVPRVLQSGELHHSLRTAPSAQFQAVSPRSEPLILTVRYRSTGR